MRSRTPSFIWVPLVFGIGAISWGILLASLAMLAALLLAPALRDVKKAEMERNDVQATVDLLNQKIALQKQFLAAVDSDPLLQQRLASRQFHLERSDQQVLMVNDAVAKGDRRIETLLDSALTPVAAEPVPPLPWPLAAALVPGVRQILLIITLGGLVLGLSLGLKYQRH